MYKVRQYIVFFIFIFFFVALSGRLFYIQILNYDKFYQMAKEQHEKTMKIDPVRGSIYDRFLEPLAVNFDIPSVFADPRSIVSDDAKQYTAKCLADILGVDEKNVYRKLLKDKAFVWIKRKVSPLKADLLKKKKLKGVHFINESKRIYPNDKLASHIIGFAGMDNNGLEGLELAYDDELKGKPGFRHFVRDARLKPVLFDDENSLPAKNGDNIVLTIDSVVQYIVEEEIEKMAKKFNAKNASILIMDPFTGRILAMANYPTYDLNNFSETPNIVRKNSAVSSVFEPGSVFKAVTASAVLNEGIVNPLEKIYCERGDYNVRRRVLHDYHPYGDLTFKKVISKSSNIGTVKAAMKLGEKKLFKYIKSFGFGEKTGIDIPGEVAGLSRHPDEWSRSDITTIPIGQGIAVTPLQLLAALAVIANDGYLVRPYIVERVTTVEGITIRETTPEIKRKVLRPETCKIMKDILSDVVRTGTGRKAASEKYEICGKTGTAQKVSPDGGYYKDKYYATFIGFAPKEHPQICMVVTTDEPHPIHFGGSVAAPTFKVIAERVLEYLGSNRSGASGADQLAGNGAG